MLNTTAATAEIAAQEAKAQAATKKVLELSAEVGRGVDNYHHPKYRALRTAIRVFKREDGRLTRLRSYWEGQAELEAEGLLDEEGRLR